MKNPWNALQDAYTRCMRPVAACSHADFLPVLLLRLYLAPIFWMAGSNKLENFSGTVEWFGNAEWGLGLPFPILMAGPATGIELAGAVMLLLGMGVRLISVP